MAVLGKYTLVKFGGSVLGAQMDANLNFENSLLETTEISGAYRYKTFDSDEKTITGSFALQYSDDTDSLLFGIYNNAQLIEVWYGGVNIGEKYYLFSAIITSIQRTDPSNGISMLNVAFTVTGVPQRLTVPDEGGQTWSLTVTVTGNGTVAKNPNKANYDDGETVVLTPTATTDWVFWKHKLAGVLSSIIPVNLLMDANKAIEFIFGFKTFDYTFTEASESVWTLINSPFVSDFQADGVYVEGTAVGSQYFYTPLMYIDLTQLFQMPVVYNRMRIYFDTTDLNFYVNGKNSEDSSTASSGEITSSGEPVFTKTFTELKYADRVEINTSIFNTTFCSMKITKIILDIV